MYQSYLDYYVGTFFCEMYIVHIQENKIYCTTLIYVDFTTLID